MDNLRELQLVELSILKDTLRLFEKHGISYYALGGTMLGAVRHKGFIPWDDDIDIGVPREAFELLETVCKDLPEGFVLRTHGNDQEYPFYVPKIVNNSYIVHSKRTRNGESQPAWIDIFPLDGMPNYSLMRKIHGFHILACRALFTMARFDEIADVSRENRPIAEKIMMWNAKNLGLQKLLREESTYENLDRTLKRYSYDRSSYNINAMGAYKLREMFDKKVFGEGALYQFEDIQIRGPQDYETYLTQLYGDWRTPADMTHHSVVGITKRDEPTE